MIKFNEFLNPENKICIKCFNFKEFKNIAMNAMVELNDISKLYKLRLMYDTSNCVAVTDHGVDSIPELYAISYRYTVVNYQDVDFSI